MYSSHPTLAARLGGNTRAIHSEAPLSEDQMRTVAPSIFALGKHASRFERYSYIPTIGVQENVIQGGLPGRSAQGRRQQTRPVQSTDRGVSLDRALWMLAEEMRKLKG